jgi:hypothetical protein
MKGVDERGRRGGRYRDGDGVVFVDDGNDTHV